MVMEDIALRIECALAELAILRVFSGRTGAKRLQHFDAHHDAAVRQLETALLLTKQRAA